MRGLSIAALLLLMLCMGATSIRAQQYTGLNGLIHVPSAEMDKVGTARIGAHFLNREFTPEKGFNFGGKYHTMSHYLSLTAFSWLQIGYTCTLQKGLPRKPSGKAMEGSAKLRFKDRYFSIKVQPLRERAGKWWPSVALGANDPYSTGGGGANDTPADDGKSMYFSNYFVAASKHLDWKGHRLGLHVAYRHWKRGYNDKWNGPVGGVTYQPSFQQNLRLIAEYTGDDVNVGFDWKLWKHLLIQSSLQNGKYFSGGLCFCIQLL